MKVKYLSTFSGIAGFEVGIEKATAGEWECVGFSEIDEYATKVYQARYPNHKNYGDITQIDPATIPDFDVLVGGFPCQSFSIAGKRGGFNDTRGTLFFEIARIVRAKRPRLLLLENVKGLLSHDGGRTFETILRALDELGYDAEWQVLNSKRHGVPHNRDRVFIIANLRDTPRPEVFPYGESTRVHTSALKAEEQEIAPCLHAAGGGPDVNDLFVIHQRPRGKNAGGFHTEAPAMTGKSYQDNNLLLAHGRVRKLTPIECERLQGFPDNWTEGLSDTRRYKALGNAVTTNVIEFIVRRIETTSK